MLDEPANFRTKEVSKLSTLESILVPENQPDLYTDYYHKVRINYYPPRNDNKEGWDNIDIFGWMGYPMQIKINFLCRDSILAAPLCLDLCLLIDLAARNGRYGTQRFLSFFLKSPMHDYTVDSSTQCSRTQSAKWADTRPTNSSTKQEHVIHTNLMITASMPHGMLAVTIYTHIYIIAYHSQKFAYTRYSY